MLGNYYPGFRRRLKVQLPRPLWRDMTTRRVPVPPAGTAEWELFKSAALNWLLKGHLLAREEDRRLAELALRARWN